MKTGFFLALRYLFSKKSNNAVNYISWISVLGFFGGSFAMIVILSTLNGFESLIISMYSHFDPDFRIERVEGKIMLFDPNHKEIFENTPGLVSLHEVLEDQAVVKHYDYQTAVYVKGVSANYFEETGLSHFVHEGSSALNEHGNQLMILGAGVDYKLQTRVNNAQTIATLYTPSRANHSISDPNIVRSKLIKPSGVVYLDDQINQKYVFVSLDFARELFERDSEISFVEIRVEKEKMKEAEKYLNKHLPEGMILKNRISQQASLYKMFKSEKWVTYALLSFVLLLASFNVTGSLTMLVVEKKKDIFTLKSLGANGVFIRSVFLNVGLLISLLGALGGLGLGSLLVTLQDKFGIVTMSGAIVESYPVRLDSGDIFLIFGTTLLLGFITSLYPAWKAYSKK